MDVRGAEPHGIRYQALDKLYDGPGVLVSQVVQVKVSIVQFEG